MAEMLFTDPDGDGQGDWSTDASIPFGDLATRSYVDSEIAVLQQQIQGGGGGGGGGTLPPNGATGLAVFATTTPVEARTVIGLDQVNNTSDVNKPLSNATITALLAKVDTTALTAALANVIATSQKGAVNGVATLDGSGKVPYPQLPTGVLLAVRQNSDGTWPGRPVSPNTVMWIGGEIAPGGGSFTSGTGMVDGTDVQLLGPG